MARNRNRKLSCQSHQATVESFSNEGRGIAHIEDKVVFIDGALPGEEVRFVYTRKRRGSAEGKVTEIVVPSKQRIQPECPHFSVCGGCSLQHVNSSRQIQIKLSHLEAQLTRVGKVAPNSFWRPLTGPEWQYRVKARLGVKYVIKKARVLVGFREKYSNLVAEMEQCKVLHPKIGERIADLADLIMTLSVINRVAQIEVAVGENRCALVFRILDDINQQDKEKLIDFESKHQISIYLQRQGPDSIEPLRSESPAFLSYSLPKYELDFWFKPTEFTQVNRQINRKMVDRALEIIQPGADDCILDLFCGIGNFSLPLARYAGRVVGVEGSSSLVERAKQNANSNGLTNVEFFKADLCSELSSEPWAKRNYNKILLDPSRAGAQEILVQFPRWKTERIVYISCNPATLARDAGILVNELGYSIECAGIIDMFPHTAHVESIVLFEKSL